MKSGLQALIEHPETVQLQHDGSGRPCPLQDPTLGLRLFGQLGARNELPLLLLERSALEQGAAIVGGAEPAFCLPLQLGWCKECMALAVVSLDQTAPKDGAAAFLGSPASALAVAHDHLFIQLILQRGKVLTITPHLRLAGERSMPFLGYVLFQSLDELPHTDLHTMDTPPKRVEARPPQREQMAHVAVPMGRRSSFPLPDIHQVWRQESSIICNIQKSLYTPKLLTGKSNILYTIDIQRIFTPRTPPAPSDKYLRMDWKCYPGPRYLPIRKPHERATMSHRVGIRLHTTLPGCTSETVAGLVEEILHTNCNYLDPSPDFVIINDQVLCVLHNESLCACYHLKPGSSQPSNNRNHKLSLVFERPTISVKA